jgi:hypothetical protein
MQSYQVCSVYVVLGIEPRAFCDPVKYISNNYNTILAGRSITVRFQTFSFWALSIAIYYGNQRE